MKNFFLPIRSLALVVLAAVVVLFITGCEKKQQGREVELYYYKQENQEGFRRVVKAFEKEHPDIALKPLIIPNDGDATLAARMAQNRLPAIIQVQSYARVNEYASKGYLRDLSETDAIKNVLNGGIAPVTYEGKQFAVPLDYAGIGIIYNKAIFSKLGIRPPTTWDELVEVCNTLKQNDIVPFSGLLKENWSAGQFLIMIHTYLLAEKAKTQDAAKLNYYLNDFVQRMNDGITTYGDAINSKRLFEIMDFYRENMAHGSETLIDASEMDGAAQQKQFADGTAGMMVQGLWSYVDAKKLNPTLEAGFVPFPVFNDPAMNRIYADVGSAFCVTNQVSEQTQEDAVTFLNWLSSDAGKEHWVKDYGITHSFKGGDFSVLGVPYADLMREAAAGSYPWMSHRYPSVVYEDACKNYGQQYLLGFIDADKVLSNIDECWKMAVEQQKGN